MAASRCLATHVIVPRTILRADPLQHVEMASACSLAAGVRAPRDMTQGRAEPLEHCELPVGSQPLAQQVLPPSPRAHRSVCDGISPGVAHQEARRKVEGLTWASTAWTISSGNLAMGLPAAAAAAAAESGSAKAPVAPSARWWSVPSLSPSLPGLVLGAFACSCSSSRGTVALKGRNRAPASVCFLDQQQ